MILFIDDEEEMDSFKLGLELSKYEYQVTLKTNIDDAWEYLGRNLNQISLVIMDVMIPPGKLLEEEDTKGGLRTGLALFDKIRGKSLSLPIVIFSSVSDQRVISQFKGKSKCLFLKKEEELPSSLPHRVHEFMKSDLENAGR